MKVDEMIKLIEEKQDLNFQQLYKNVHNSSKYTDEDKDLVIKTIESKMRSVQSRAANKIFGPKDAEGREFLKSLLEELQGEFDLSNSKLEVRIKVGGSMITGENYVDVYFDYKNDQNWKIGLGYVIQNSGDSPFIRLIKFQTNSQHQQEIIEYPLEDYLEGFNLYKSWLIELLQKQDADSSSKENLPFQSGHKMLRKELHKKYGGSGQGGISSTKSGYIFLFSDPDVGEEFGYRDGWKDGVFYYYGQGQEGDMEFKRGNKSILEHRSNNQPIHLFMGAKGEVTYENEFILDENHPYEVLEDIDKNDQPRMAIVFRLIPINPYESLINETNIEISHDTVVENVDVESFNTSEFIVQSSEERVGERKESKLLKDYIDYRDKENLALLTSKKINVKGESAKTILKVDGWVEEERLLIEAKSSCTRNSIRLAIGQLLDYQRFVNPERMAILLPDKPKQDLCDLLQSLDIQLIYKDKNTFNILN